MEIKKGGGNKPQLYDTNNGQYIDENPRSRNEKDSFNIIGQKLFGLKLDKEITYPIFGVHDKEYCQLVIDYCLNKQNPTLQDEKIHSYLLVYRPKDDKSRILNSLGYHLENWHILKENILKGTKFKVCKLSNFNEMAFTISTETVLINLKTKKPFYCETIWQIEKNFTLRFITLIPRYFTYGK